MRKNNQFYVRKAHRWLGVIIGIQFIFWTVSGLYFSWTDIDEIHGDHFLKEEVKQPLINWNGTQVIDSSLKIKSFQLKFVNDVPYLWVNDSLMINYYSGEIKSGFSAEEAKNIAQYYVKDNYNVIGAELISSTNGHHEFRGRTLPAWKISFDSEDELVAYVSQNNGEFKRVRHNSWRWFDFLWMFHTMDYEGRDDFNNLLLRIFSLFGLITVMSGFTLFFMTTKRKRK